MAVTGSEPLPVVAAVMATLARLSETHRPAIAAVAGLFADRVAQGGLIHVFGAGHSHLLAEELFFRAGGLLIFNPLLDSALMLHESALAAALTERLTEYAHVVLSKYEIHPEDALLVISYSGINPVPVEIALEGKRRGLPVVALTSVQASQACPSRHPTGRRLCEVADLVLDNPGPPGDAVLALPGLEARLCSLSTIVGAVILQAVVYETARCLLARGITPPVVVSVNAPGNGALDLASLARHRQRLRHL